MWQRLLRLLGGLNFKEFVAFLSAFSPRATLQQKIECSESFLVAMCNSFFLQVNLLAAEIFLWMLFVL